MDIHTSNRIIAWVSTALVIVAFVFLFWWLDRATDLKMSQRIPLPTEQGRLTPGAGPREAPVNIKGQFQAFGSLPTASSGSWPRFRGADMSNVSPDTTPLANSWPPEGPPKLWSVAALGEGHAGAAIYNGRVYLMDYDEEEGADTLRCLALSDGREIWRRAYKVHVKRNHGMSRTVPTISDNYIVTVGPKCHVMCLDVNTGDFIWGIDMVAQFGTTIPLWYTAQCPLIDGDEVVLAPGGNALMVGVDLATGQVKWETPNPDGWEMSHACVIPLTLAGTRTFVYPAIGGTYGISAETYDRGSLLWKTNDWNGSVICPNAVQVDESRIFMSSGYGMGSLMFKIEKSAEGFTATTDFRREKTTFGSEQQTPVFYRDHIFGILPKDAAARREQLVCLDTSGELVWTSGKTERFGLGPYLIADDKLFVLNDDGELSLIRATTDSYQLLARAKVLDGRDAWAPMAIADGLLLLRDSRVLSCLDVRANPASN